MFNRIEICGLIASGKTTFVQACNQLTNNLIFENFANIISLKDFYKNSSEFALETELMFTLQHYYQLKKGQKEHKNIVADFSLAGDYAYALTTLSNNEMNVYRQLFDYLLSQIGYPEKIIYLHAQTDTLIKRIQSRARIYEQTIKYSYLKDLEKNLDMVLKDMFYNKVEIIEINTELKPYCEYTLELIKTILNR